jgi:glycosyltransferase involved in cell wall biosynthesis
MNILYITSEINRRNGWATLSYYTIKGAVERGCRATAIIGKGFRSESIPGVRYHDLLTCFSDGPLKLPRMFRDSRSINRMLQQEQFDWVHILIEPYLPLALLLRHRCMLLNIIGTYSVQPFQQGMYRWLYRSALRRIRHILSISDYTALRFAENNTAGVPVSVLPLGVDNSLYQSSPEQAAEVKEDAFCFVGQIKPRKGLLYAVKAVERLKATRPQVRLYVIGQEDFGDYAGQCRQYIAEKNLSENVIFTGQVSEEQKRAYYRKCLANVLPSVNTKYYFEGFGLIHLEANASSIPSIGSRGCGNESAITDGVNGFLCPQEDVAALAERMQYVLSIRDTQAYTELCERCRRYAHEHDWVKYAQQVVKVYREQRSRDHETPSY